MRRFKKGELVWWTDPETAQDGLVEVMEGNENKLSADVTETDTIWVWADGADYWFEVPATRLQKQVDKRCPDCQSVLFDEPVDRTYQYWCVICKKQYLGFEAEENK
jgi:hypothetical protein